MVDCGKTNILPVKHNTFVLQRLDKQRKNGMFCDATLIVEGEKFRVHRSFLAANSDYFLSLFTSAEEQQNFVLAGVPLQGFRVILDFIYTSTFVLNMTNIHDVYKASSALDFKHVQTACEKVYRKIKQIERSAPGRPHQDPVSLRQASSHQQSATQNNEEIERTKTTQSPSHRQSPADLSPLRASLNLKRLPDSSEPMSNSTEKPLTEESDRFTSLEVNSLPTSSSDNGTCKNEDSLESNNSLDLSMASTKRRINEPKKKVENFKNSTDESSTKRQKLIHLSKDCKSQDDVENCWRRTSLSPASPKKSILKDDIDEEKKCVIERYHKVQNSISPKSEENTKLNPLKPRTLTTFQKEVKTEVNNQESSRLELFRSSSEPTLQSCKDFSITNSFKDNTSSAFKEKQDYTLFFKTSVAHSESEIEINNSQQLVTESASKSRQLLLSKLNESDHHELKDHKPSFVQIKTHRNRRKLLKTNKICTYVE